MSSEILVSDLGQAMCKKIHSDPDEKEFNDSFIE